MQLDAQDQVFFERQLTTVKKTVQQAEFPEFLARTLFPTSFEVDPADETIIWEYFTRTGIAKIVNNYANDFPNVSVKGEENISRVKSLGDSYEYNIQEIRASSRANRDLKSMKALAAKEAMMMLENKLAFFGNTKNNIPGFITNPNVPIGPVASDGVGNSPLWADKSSDQIIRDVSLMIAEIRNVTKNVERPDTVLMPITAWNELKVARTGAAGDMTIARFLQVNNPEITSWVDVPEFETAGPGNSRLMAAYKRDPSRLTMEIPLEFEQWPETLVGGNYNIPCHQRFGGVLIYKPLSINFKHGF